MQTNSSTLVGGVFRAMYETPSEALERLKEAGRPVPMSRNLLDLTKDVDERTRLAQPWLPRPTETCGRNINIYA